MSEAPSLVDAGRQQAAGASVALMYERHARSLFGLCRMLLRDPHEAEDALQATFLAAHRAVLRGGGPREEAAWLATIARNECRGRIRERMRGPVNTGDEGLEATPDPAPGPEERLRDPEVARALAQLPDSQREAVVLHDVLGLRAREVGTVLGMSVPAVEALLFRGRRQLRLRLRPAHGVLVVPLGVGEALAQAIPGFATSEAAAAVAGGAGIAGAGLLAKLVGAPTIAKVAAGVAVVATAGSVAAVESQPPDERITRASAQPSASRERAGGGTTGNAPGGSAVTLARGGVVGDTGEGTGSDSAGGSDAGARDDDVHADGGERAGPDEREADSDDGAGGGASGSRGSGEGAGGGDDGSDGSGRGDDDAAARTASGEGEDDREEGPSDDDDDEREADESQEDSSDSGSDDSSRSDGESEAGGDSDDGSGSDGDSDVGAEPGEPDEPQTADEAEDESDENDATTTGG